MVARCRLARMSSSTLFDRATSAAHHEHATEDRRTRQAGRAAPARKHVAELVEVEVRRSHSARHKTARHGSLEEIARVERSALAHATVNEGDPTRARAVASSWREFRACVVVKIRASHVHLLDIHRERSRSASDGAACEPLSLSGSHAAESTLPSRRCSQSGASGQGEARRGRTSRRLLSRARSRPLLSRGNSKAAGAPSIARLAAPMERRRVRPRTGHGPARALAQARGLTAAPQPRRRRPSWRRAARTPR